MQRNTKTTLFSAFQSLRSQRFSLSIFDTIGPLVIKKNTFNCQCKNKTFDLAITTSAIFCQKQEAGYPFYQVEAPASQKLNATKIVEMRSLVFEKINSNEIRK